MSWSELERLVESAEQDGRLRSALRHCRSRSELVLAARRLQFRISLHDLQRAWSLHVRDTDSSVALPSPGQDQAQRLQA